MFCSLADQIVNQFVIQTGWHLLFFHFLGTFSAIQVLGQASHSKTTQALPSSQNILGQGPWNICIFFNSLDDSISSPNLENKCPLLPPTLRPPMQTHSHRAWTPRAVQIMRVFSLLTQRLPATFPPYLLLTIIKHISLGWGDKFPVLSVGNGHSVMYPRSHTISWSEI